MTKEEIKHINSLEKGRVYKMFGIVNYQNKLYEKITKRKMIEETYLSIQAGDKYLKSSVLKKDLVILVEAINTGQTIIKITPENKNSAYRLSNAFLLFYYYEFDVYEIPSDFLTIFKDYDLTNFVDELDEFYYFINGLLITRGQISISEAESIYKVVKPKALNLDFKKGLELTKHKIDILNLFELSKNKILISIIINSHFTINKNYPKPNYTFDTYKTFGKFGIDINTQQGAKIYKVISKELENNYPYFFLYRFVVDTGDPEKTISKRMVEVLIEGQNDDFDKGFEMYNELVSIMPRWDFWGTIQKNIKTEDISGFYEQLAEKNKKSITTCLCGSGLLRGKCCENDNLLLKNRAIVDEQMAYNFYGIINDLIFLANQHYQLLKVYNPRTFIERLSQEDYMKLKNLALGSKEVLGKYIDLNKDVFDDVALEIIQGLQNSYKAKFVALEYLNQKLVVFDEAKKCRFILSGIISPLSESIAFTELPSFFETRLIPLSDRIIYDIMISIVPISLGSGIKKQLEKAILGTKVLSNIDDFKRTKNNG